MVEFGVNKMLDFYTFDIKVHINTISQSIKSVKKKKHHTKISTYYIKHNSLSKSYPS